MKHILIIENDQSTRTTIEAALENKSTTLSFANDGEQGIEMLQKLNSSINLILLDLMLPKKSGIEVCQFMTSSDTLKHIPVVIISALPVNSPDFRESMKMLKELNVVKDQLEKPFTIQQLLDKITKNLD